jgi:hypothetical protein
LILRALPCFASSPALLGSSLRRAFEITHCVFAAESDRSARPSSSAAPRPAPSGSVLESFSLAADEASGTSSVASGSARKHSVAVASLSLLHKCFVQLSCEQMDGTSAEPLSDVALLVAIRTFLETELLQATASSGSDADSGAEERSGDPQVSATERIACEILTEGWELFYPTWQVSTTARLFVTASTDLSYVLFVV